MELDEFDAASRHAVARGPAGEAIGTGRLLPDGHIGRLAVLADWRGKGAGRALLETLMDEARQRGIAALALNAQTAATGFYERFGFVAEGETFLDAGIPHVRMTRRA
ncbi:MAG: GNAT family N-acetyltransferase [Ignavibacteria bacterium]